jgi:16S rRNA (adenine1518-N6/adenine1519-N6)-dimethyltransferase
MKSNISGNNPKKIKDLIREYGLRPKKSLGQNFLITPVHNLKIINSAGLLGNEIVLEIGPGLGSLTQLLAKRAKKIIAVELDSTLIPPLREILSGYTNVEIIQGDILKKDLSNLIPESNYVVIANIPYYITSKLIRKLLEAPNRPNRIILTVQHEVAQRICATPPDMNLLGLSVQVYGKPNFVGKIPAGAFYPIPKVDSGIIRIDILNSPRILPEIIDIFFKLIKAGFNQKRKNLRNSLSSGLSLSKLEMEEILLRAGIDPTRRPQTLNINEWELISRCYFEFLTNHVRAG